MSIDSSEVRLSEVAPTDSGLVEANPPEANISEATTPEASTPNTSVPKAAQAEAAAGELTVSKVHPTDATPHEVIASGAGHDASLFANAGIPSGMLFIRNRNGSHNPAEAMDMGDFMLGVQVLSDTVEQVA